MLTNAWDFTVRVWDIPKAAEGEVGRLILSSQVLTAMELGPDGSARDLDDVSWMDRRNRLERRGGPSIPP